MRRLGAAARPVLHAMLLGLAGVLSCADGGSGSRTEALTSLVEAERAFARSAAELGTRDAFLAFLADDGVLFRPRALKGKEWLAKQPATPGLLAWEPRYADVAASGDLGFTFGPWAYSPEGGDSVVARGYYFSVWRRQPDGVWKVAIDHGTMSGPPAEGGRLETVLALEDGEARSTIDPKAARSELYEADLRFSGAVRSERSAGTLDRFVSARTRLIRDGQPPVLASSLSSPVSAWQTPMYWEVLGGDVSSSGTFGYTFGEYEIRDTSDSRAIEDGNYLRAWRRDSDGSWKIEAELMSPVPRRPAE